MKRLLDRVVPLIAPTLKEKVLLSFPSEEQSKTRIYFGSRMAEIEAGTLGYYFTIKEQQEGKILGSGAEDSLHGALSRIFDFLHKNGADPAIQRAA
jgi:hypothetical protein